MALNQYGYDLLIITPSYLIIGLTTFLVFCLFYATNGFVRPRNRDHYSRKWSRIQKLSHMKESRPLAIIYANSLLDHALKKLEYAGETMSQRLASAEHQFKNKKQVLDVNQLRNRIVHDTDMQVLTVRQTQQALQIFRRALVDLGVLSSKSIIYSLSSLKVMNVHKTSDIDMTHYANSIS